MAVAASALLLAACSGGADRAADPTTDESLMTTPATTTTELTTTEAEPEPEPEPEPALTHRQFIRELDDLCRRGNRRLERAVSDAEWEAAWAVQDYGRIVRLWVKGQRINRSFRFYAKMRKLNEPERDTKPLARYLKLTRQLDVIGNRQLAALRKRDLEEFNRLQGIRERLANRRTTVTTAMGLRECGSG